MSKININDWRRQVTTQLKPGSYRLLLTLLSEHVGCLGIMRMTDAFYGEMLRCTGLDVSDVNALLERAQGERRLTLYVPQKPIPSRRGMLLVELQ